MKKLTDLRFVIGLFFLIIGLLLLGYYFLFFSTPDYKVNAVCGGIFILFGLIMMVFSEKTKVEGQEN